MIHDWPDSYVFHNVLLYCSAAIESLRKELADLKLQMMRNVKHLDSSSRTPSLHSHSTIKRPPSPTMTTSRLNSCESSSQPKLLTRVASSNSSASSLPPHRIETPSSHRTLTNGGRSSQMTTSTSTNNTHSNTPSSHHAFTNGGQLSQMTTNNTHPNAPSSHHTLANGGRSSHMASASLISNNTHPNTPSSHHTLTNGGRSSQMSLITNNTDPDTLSSHHSLTNSWRSSQHTLPNDGRSSQHTITNGGQFSQMIATSLTSCTTNTSTPSHSSKSATSLSHTHSSQGSSTTAVTKAGLTPNSSPGGSRQPSSIRLSTPALSSFASLKSTPLPTPQHSEIGHTMSGASFRRPSLIASGRGPRGPSNGYASSSNAPDQPGYCGSALDHNESDHVRYPYSSRPTSIATVPSTIIRRQSTRGSINRYRPPSYDEARMIPSYSNRATANSSSIPPSAMSAPLEPSDIEGCATEIGNSVAECTNNNACHHCGERTTQVTSRNGTRSSHGSMTHRQIYAPSYNANSLREWSQNHHNAESGGTQVDTGHALVQSDHEMGHGPYARSGDTSNMTSFNGPQTPMATSTPSRRNAVLNARHIHAQTPHCARDKLSERFKASKEPTDRENAARTGVPASSKNIPTSASRENDFRRYSSTAASHSPQSERKDNEDFTVYSTHSSPARSHAHGYSSGASLSAQSSPGRGYSNSTRRASSPALYSNARRKSYYGERIVREHGRARHSGDYPEVFSSDSDEERRHHLDQQETHLSPEGPDEELATCTHDDRTPHVHVHVPVNARHVSIKRHKPSHYRDDHYSDPETSPEHHYCHGHSKPRVVKVIETPKLRKKQFVYIASDDPPPEEIYYSESGLGLFTPQQASHGRRVVGVVEGRNGRSVSRARGGDGGVRVTRLRGRSRPRKVYVEQPSEPVKRVYIVEQESGSDLEQFETLEVSRLILCMGMVKIIKFYK